MGHNYHTNVAELVLQHWQPRCCKLLEVRTSKCLAPGHIRHLLNSSLLAVTPVELSWSVPDGWSLLPTALDLQRKQQPYPLPCLEIVTDVYLCTWLLGCAVKHFLRIKCHKIIQYMYTDIMFSLTLFMEIWINYASILYDLIILKYFHFSSNYQIVLGQHDRISRQEGEPTIYEVESVIRVRHHSSTMHSLLQNTSWEFEWNYQRSTGSQAPIWAMERTCHVISVQIWCSRGWESIMKHFVK